jgi:hypothetical protein
MLVTNIERDKMNSRTKKSASISGRLGCADALDTPASSA